MNRGRTARRSSRRTRTSSPRPASLPPRRVPMPAAAELPRQACHVEAAAGTETHLHRGGRNLLEGDGDLDPPDGPNVVDEVLADLQSQPGPRLRGAGHLA